MAGVPVLDGYGVGEMCSGGRGQHLLPWPNRVRDGRYRFGEWQPALDFPTYDAALNRIKAAIKLAASENRG